MKTVMGSVMVIAFVVGVRLHGATPVQGDAAKIAAGKAVYAAQKCSTCHMIGNAGSKAASVLDGVGSKLKEDEIRKWLTSTAEMEAKLATKPKMSMVPFMKTKKLSDDDVASLTAYLASLKK
jgi:mono/diheme cytochrome c family protein